MEIIASNPSEGKEVPTGKTFRDLKFDKVLYKGGQPYFIKGRMSSYAILTDIHNQKISLKPIPKFQKMQREDARKSWITSQKAIVNF